MSAERPFTAQEILATHQDELTEGYSAGVDADLSRRYVLLERNMFDHSYWLTSHDTPGDAIEYHDSQESVEDWTASLYDTESGVRFLGVISTRWELHPDGPELHSEVES